MTLYDVCMLRVLKAELCCCVSVTYHAVLIIKTVFVFSLELLQSDDVNYSLGPKLRDIDRMFQSHHHRYLNSVLSLTIYSLGSKLRVKISNHIITDSLGSKLTV